VARRGQDWPIDRHRLSTDGAVVALLAVLASSVSLVAVAGAPPPEDSPIVNPDAVVDPGPTQTERPAGDADGTDPGTTDTTGTDTGTTDTTGTGTGTDTTGTDPTNTDGTGTDGTVTGAVDEEMTPRSPAFGNAARRPLEVKEQEAARDCVDSRPKNSRMLAIGGSVPHDDDGSFGGLALAIAVGAALVALIAFGLRRWGRGERVATPGPLEVTATVVAIFGGLAGLVVQFVPGARVDPPPITETTLKVREVHARITRGEYARKTGAEVGRIPEIDRREVGDVIWLEIGLTGYREKRPRLQYALYNPDRSGTLLPATGQTVDLRVEDSDAQTLVVPVWVGFPSSDRFQAKFRLLDGEVVRQIAATGKLSSSPYRYACDEDI
jgi:hypothetical protein